MRLRGVRVGEVGAEVGAAALLARIRGQGREPRDVEQAGGLGIGGAGEGIERRDCLREPVGVALQSAVLPHDAAHGIAHRRAIAPARHEGHGFGARAKAFLVRNPPLYALIIALLLPDSLSPSWGPHAAEIISLALAPIGFFALGVNLLREHDEDGVRIFPPPFTAPVATAVFLRLVFAPALVLGLSAVIVEVPRAFLVEAAMASGINGLAVAHLFGLNMRIVVGAVSWSSLIVVIAAVAAGVFGVF